MFNLKPEPYKAYRTYKEILNVLYGSKNLISQIFIDDILNQNQ